MVDFVNNVRSFVNYAIFCELCDWMRFEVDCAKSHHRVISEGLHNHLSVPEVLNNVQFQKIFTPNPRKVHEKFQRSKI